MKKITELEERWKSYKYKIAIFYIFIVVFIIFILFLGYFIKYQYDRYTSAKIPAQNVASVSNKQNNQSNIQVPEKSNNTNSNIVASSTNKINFVCRQVLVDRLTVRSAASFKSKPVGYYTRDSIFCASDDNVNGLVQTANGWISENDAYSQKVEVNMFVDSGFHRYQDQIAKTDIEEIRILTPSAQPNDSQPTRYPSVAQNDKINIAPNDNHSANQTQNIPNAPVSAPIVKRQKPLINITSEKITKEREIQLKEADFKYTNKYDTAIEVAEYYYNTKDYTNSIKWALNASNAESDGKVKVESWIIYAKSLYASGKKEQAMEVLSRYISSTQSKDAIDVLNNMKKGII